MESREPWMRGTHGDLDVVRRAIVHALEQAAEDGDRWAAGLTKDEVHARPAGLASVAFHLRHAVRSLDRLLCYADNRSLNDRQLAALRSEMETGDETAAVMQEFREGLARAVERVRAFLPEMYGEARGIGRQRLPTTVAGLLIHCAEHTQRHMGQMVTTAKVVRGSVEVKLDGIVSEQVLLDTEGRRDG